MNFIAIGPQSVGGANAGRAHRVIRMRSRSAIGAWARRGGWIAANRPLDALPAANYPSAANTSIEGNDVAVMQVPQGHVLYRPDDQCDGFVIVHEGTAKVSLTAENGREIVLYRVRPGEICLQTFGCLVNGSTYSAEAVAETPLQLEVIPAGDFHTKVASDPAFRQHLFAAVAARFSDLERLVEDVALSTIEERLARALLRLAGEADTVDATHEALATEIGSARAVVSRQLGAFQRLRLIGIARGHIALLDRAGLLALAHTDT